MTSSGGTTIRAFDDDLDRLRSLISELGGLAEYNIRESMRCLVEGDLAGARHVVDHDRELDKLEIETERHAVRLIAVRAPMAGDLRHVVLALKISSVIERIGDYARNIARRVPLLDELGNVQPLSVLQEMARIATEMVHDVLTAFVERDSKAALRVIERDRKVNDFYNFIFRTLLTYMLENPHNITQSTHLLFVAKNIERVGDHAINIAEMVYHAETGQYLGDRKKGTDALAAEAE